jgi:hypothetical protein
MTTLQLLMIDPVSGCHEIVNIALPPSPEDPRDRLRRMKDRLHATLTAFITTDGKG